MQKERMWKWPGESLFFNHRFFGARAPARSPSDPLAASLPHLQRFCLCGNTPWPGKVWPFFPEGHILVFPLQEPANGGLFSLRSNYALEGRSSLFSLPEGKWSLSWQPSQHTPTPVLVLAHVDAITRTFLLPSSPKRYAELSLGELPLLQWETGGDMTVTLLSRWKPFLNFCGIHALLRQGGDAEEQGEVFSEECLGSLNSSKTFWDESLSGVSITGDPSYVIGGLQPNWQQAWSLVPNTFLVLAS